jgi:conjugative transfer region protein TrbK
MRARPVKARTINWGCVGPLLAYVAVAGALVGGAMHLGQRSHRTAALATHVTVRHQDELLRELVHCQALGTKSADDMGCIEAWAQNRRRFFEAGVRPSSQRPSHP